MKFFSSRNGLHPYLLTLPLWGALVMFHEVGIEGEWGGKYVFLLFQGVVEGLRSIYMQA